MRCWQTELWLDLLQEFPYFCNSQVSFFNGLHFIHLNLYNVMHSKTEHYLLHPRKNLKSCLPSACRKFTRIFSAFTHSQSFLLSFYPAPQIIFKREVTILFIASITAWFDHDRKPPSLLGLEWDYFIYNFFITERKIEHTSWMSLSKLISWRPEILHTTVIPKCLGIWTLTFLNNH